MICDETIKSTDLTVMLSEVTGAVPVSLVTETEPPVYKGSPVIIKRSEVNGIIHGPKRDEENRKNEYQRAVNRQLEREGKTADFEGKDLPWGIRFNETCLIVNQGKDGKPRAYVRIQIEQTKSPKYFLNGQEVEFDDVKQYLRPRSNSSRQGTDKEVIVRNYQVTPGSCTVKAIAINGRKMLVEDSK